MPFNWHDGSTGHRIGAHRNRVDGPIPGSPFCTISFGEARIFRFSRRSETGGPEKWEFPVEDGSTMRFERENNLHWKHEVPHFKADQGRRVSITLRDFEPKTAGIRSNPTTPTESEAIQVESDSIPETRLHENSQIRFRRNDGFAAD